MIQERNCIISDNLCKFGDQMEKIFREIKSQISFKKTAHINFPAHIHDDIELVYIQSGKGTAWCDGKAYALTDGAWFLVFPNQVHRYADFTTGSYYVLILKPSDLLRYQQVFRTGAPKCAAHCLQGNTRLYSLLDAAFQDYQEDGYSEVIAAYLTALFGKLLPYFPVEKAAFQRDTVLKILEYCSVRYKEDLTEESVAAELDLSRSCVSHIFSDRICMSFNDYINSLRLSEATEILKNQDYSITEIANLSGFPTIRTFNRAFKKHYGTTPTEYRKKMVR